jgi:hypothetical protein
MALGSKARRQSPPPYNVEKLLSFEPGLKALRERLGSFSAHNLEVPEGTLNPHRDLLLTIQERVAKVFRRLDADTENIQSYLAGGPANQKASPEAMLTRWTGLRFQLEVLGCGTLGAVGRSRLNKIQLADLPLILKELEGTLEKLESTIEPMVGAPSESLATPLVPSVAAL